MPWRTESHFAGFSQVEPWLPVDPGHVPLAVDVQEATAGSTLHAFRQFIATRQGSIALRAGNITFLEAPDEVLAFTRETANERATCIFNLGERTRRWRPPLAEAAQVRAAVGVTGTQAPKTLPALAGYITIETIGNTP